jgi:CRP-like cAMP-binding protein
MDKTKIKVQAFLSKVPLFNSMRADELDRLALGTTELRVERGEIIFRRGDPCVGFHVVLYGQVKLSFISAGGAEKVIEIIGPGHSFGEALMFMEKDYIVTAQAMDDTLLLHVSKPVIFREINDDPAFACKMLAGLSQRMHGLMCDMESISLRSGTQRVAAYLLKDQGDAGAAAAPTMTLSVAKSVVASRLNLTPEHFSRIMADLSARKLIAFQGRKVSILDEGALRRCAG